MTLTKKQITTLLLLLGLIVGIFLTIYLVKQRQDIRPRALQGKANLLLSAGNTSPKVGDSFDVLVSLQLTDANLQVSGADVMILYDKTKLQVTNLLPEVPSVNPSAAFTDAPIVTYGRVFDDSFNFARVSLVARKTTANLAKGTVSLARVTFKSLSTGTATIKFPDDDNLLQIVGYGLGIPTVIPPSVTPNISTTPSPTGPTLTPTPTPTGPTLTPSPTPTGPTLTPSPTPAGGVNVRGFIFKENVKDGIKGPNEIVISGVPLKIEKLRNDSTFIDKGTVISNAGNTVRNYIFYGMTTGSYKIDKPQIDGYVVEDCADITPPAPTNIPVGDYFYCLNNTNYKLKKWTSNGFIQVAGGNVFDVGNNAVGIDFPMRPAP